MLHRQGRMQTERTLPVHDTVPERYGYHRTVFHDLGLCCTTNTGYGNTRVNRRTNTGVEQVGFREDLTIGNGDYVGWNERRNVTRLSFDNRQRSQRTGFPFTSPLVKASTYSALTRAARSSRRVEVEYVARECFHVPADDGAAGDLTVSNSLFRQVIVNDQRIFTAVTEVFAHCATSVRCGIAVQRIQTRLLPQRWC